MAGLVMWWTWVDGARLHSSQIGYSIIFIFLILRHRASSQYRRAIYAGRRGSLMSGKDPVRLLSTVLVIALYRAS